MKKLLELSMATKVGLAILLVIIIVSLFFGDIRAWLGIPIYFLLIFIILYFDEPECWEDLKPIVPKIKEEKENYIDIPDLTFSEHEPKEGNKESKNFLRDLKAGKFNTK